MATQAEIQARLTRYLEAETAILKNQSYTIGTRTYTRANLRSVQEEIRALQAQLTGAVSSGTMRVRKIIFRDD